MRNFHFVVEALAMAIVLTASTFAQAQEAEPEATKPATEEAAPQRRLPRHQLRLPPRETTRATP
jgi:hypothetical protein